MDHRKLFDLEMVETVTERDIDLLVLEELHSSTEFLSWFAERCSIPKNGQCDLLGAWHSVTDGSLGESDLVLLLRISPEKRFCILIENKINAPPQPEQALRYRERGQAGITRGDWDDYTSVIIAPKKYLSSCWAEGYDHHISYEAINSQLMSSDLAPARMRFKTSLIDAAIQQGRRGYRPVADPVVMRFYKEYHSFVLEEFAELNMKAPGIVPSGSDWIHFRPVGLAPRFILRHKLRAGRVDLEMSGCGHLADRIRTDNAEILGEDIGVVVAGKSAALSITVPPMDRTADFSRQIAAARLGAKAALRLWALSPAVRWPDQER